MHGEIMHTVLTVHPCMVHAPVCCSVQGFGYNRNVFRIFMLYSLNIETSVFRFDVLFLGENTFKIPHC